MLEQMRIVDGQGFTYYLDNVGGELDLNFDENTSSGMVIFKSFLTETWQESLQPSFFSLELKCDSSVGRIEPPPSAIWHLH